MPQLVKGGKFVYGLSVIGQDGTIVVPPEAMREYAYIEGDRVIIMSGSRKSGGFGLTQTRLLAKSELKVMMEKLPELAGFQIPEAETIGDGKRLFCWTLIREGGCINIALRTLSRYGLEPGEPLVVARGSYLSIAFIARGPLFEEALKHPELDVFGG